MLDPKSVTPSPKLPAEQTIASGDVGIRVYDWGHASAPAMILVHGIEDFALSLGPVAEAFRASHRVIGYDLRGHGDSDKPGLYSLPHYQADLHAIITTLGLERPVLVGHSLGGQIVSHYAAVFDEVPSAVISVEGLGPPFRPSEVPVERDRRRARAGIELLAGTARPRRPIPDFETALLLFRRGHPQLASERARFLVARATEPHPQGGLRWKWDPRVRTTWLSVDPRTTEKRWGWIRCPVLLVTAGRSGEFWSGRRGINEEVAEMPADELERRIGLFADARHARIADAGHMVHYDEPEELIAVMRDFLSSLPADPASV